MNKILQAKAQIQLIALACAVEIQAEKEGWDSDPSWVARGKDGRFGGGSTASKAIRKAKGEVKKIKSTVEGFQRDFNKISRENLKKILDVIWSDGAKEARKDIAKALDRHLPGAGKSFEESVNFINKEIIDRTDPNWDKMIVNSFARNLGRLKRRALDESTPIDRIDDAADVIGGAFARAFTVGVISVASKLIAIPSQIAWKSLEFETEVIGNFYADAFKSGDPVAYARRQSVIGLAFYGVLMYGAFRYIAKDLFDEIDEIERTFSKDIAPEVKKGIEAMQEDVDKKWRSQQAELNLKLLAEDKESN